MFKAQFLNLLVITGCIALTACSSPQSPEQITNSFWAAIETREPNKVRKFVSAKDRDALASLEDVLPVTLESLGKIVIDGSNASVETHVTVTGDRPIEFPLNTFLVMENERWRVDYERTIKSVSSASQLATVIDQVRQFGTAVQEGLDRSVQELQNSLPKIEQELSRIESEIKQQMPELREKLQSFARELEDALKAPPPEPGAEAAEPGQPVEI